MRDTQIFCPIPLRTKKTAFQKRRLTPAKYETYKRVSDERKHSGSDMAQQNWDVRYERQSDPFSEEDKRRVRQQGNSDSVCLGCCTHVLSGLGRLCAVRSFPVEMVLCSCFCIPPLLGRTVHAVLPMLRGDHDVCEETDKEKMMPKRFAEDHKMAVGVYNRSVRYPLLQENKMISGGMEWLFQWTQQNHCWTVELRKHRI